MNDTQAIQTYTEELLAHLGVDQASVTCQLEEDDVVEVHIDVAEADSGMLIGFHGETIGNIQRLLNSSFQQESGGVIRVNVNDYRQKREKVVTEMAEKIADRVRETGQDEALPALPANERLLVHMALKDDPELETYSQGEGIHRRVVIAIKQQEE